MASKSTTIQKQQMQQKQIRIPMNRNINRNPLLSSLSSSSLPSLSHLRIIQNKDEAVATAVGIIDNGDVEEKSSIIANEDYDDLRATCSSSQEISSFDTESMSISTTTTVSTASTESSYSLSSSSSFGNDVDDDNNNNDNDVNVTVTVNVDVGNRLVSLRQVLVSDRLLLSLVFSLSHRR